MFRATTPLQEFELPFNTQDYDIKEVVVTYSQKDDKTLEEKDILERRIVLEKTEDDVTFVGNKISYRLTQEETLLFAVGVILIQIRFMDGENNVVASDIFYDRMNGVLNNKILGKPREPITEELTATENGEYYPSENKVGFSKVTVQVADTNGSYDEGYAQGVEVGNKALVKVISANSLYSLTAQELQGATNIRSQAFQDDSNLENIEFPDSVTSIGNNAFYYCTNLKTIKFSNNLTSIGDNAFIACYDLESIELPNSITKIGRTAFQSCTSLKTVILPNNLEKLNDSVFNSCREITNIKIPNSVTSIGGQAFNYCEKLTNVIMGNNILEIGNMAFDGCSLLKALTIPASVTNIGNYALRIGYPSNKATITFLGTTPPIITTNTFATSYLDKIIVPKGSRATYIASTNWATYADYIVESEV